jgi:hypothetical protein
LDVRRFRQLESRRYAERVSEPVRKHAFDLTHFFRPRSQTRCTRHRNKFASFVYGLADRLNSGAAVGDLDDVERTLSVEATGVQCLMQGISLYPFIAVLERTSGRVSEFVAPKHGTEWQPFLS